ncbi:TetR/AcrR family transcriptional regulator [Gordonia sp. X0973]|uniref:TetR/AcrR family transcriptional regulator n=1 Tax=Gordonia sp. X0973 TaxID=2742602 RepID=UPI002657344F|nr:TetR/AcrR family transcriptional regulator [Gordonia sp. X0973]
MPDARTERWAEHRKKMRRTLVDAAIRAIDAQGPHVSMREIAAEAKIPKPTLYRFFTDKWELVNAINDRVMDTLTDRIVMGPQLTAGTLGEMVHDGIAGYADFVSRHPRVFRFLQLNFSGANAGAASPGVHAIETARTMAFDISSVLSALVPGASEERSDGIHELDAAAAMIMGAVVFAADGWVGDDVPTESVESFVDRTAPYIRALLAVAASKTGNAELDFDASIAENLAAVYAS